MWMRAYVCYDSYFSRRRMLGFDRPLYEIIMPVSSRLFDRISHGEEMR